MNITESMLQGDEEIVDFIADQHGYLEADVYVSDFNNACQHMAGFEECLIAMRGNPHVFYAPPTSLSKYHNN